MVGYVIMRNEKFEDLYGKNVISFMFTLSTKTGQGFSERKNDVKIDEPRSGVAPCDGCDIIIHGASTNSKRVYSINPDLIQQTLSTNWNGNLNITLHGYVMDDEQYKIIKKQFIDWASTLVFNYVEEKTSEFKKVSELIGILITNN